MKKQKLFWLLVVVGLLLVALGVWLWSASAEKGKISLERSASQEVSEDMSANKESVSVEATPSVVEEKTLEVTEKGKDQSETASQPVSINKSAETDNKIIPPAPSPAQASAADKEEKKSEESSKSSSGVVNRLVDFGFTSPSGQRTIDTIILHSSYDASGDDPYSVKGIIDQWKDYGVAPHYFVGRDGTVYRLVKDADIAYHAGVAKVPDGRTNVNEFSIGIEIANTKTDNYTDAQYAALKKLIASLKDTYKITYVLGHDDIAPGRKTDPWNFNWKKL